MNATDRRILDTVIRLTREQLELGPETAVNSGSDFYDDLGGDSLDMAELVMNLEEAFDINAPDPERQPRTMSDIAGLVRRCLTPAHAPADRG